MTASRVNARVSLLATAVGAFALTVHEVSPRAVIELSRARPARRAPRPTSCWRRWPKIPTRSAVATRGLLGPTRLGGHACEHAFTQREQADAAMRGDGQVNAPGRGERA